MTLKLGVVATDAVVGITTAFPISARVPSFAAALTDLTRSKILLGTTSNSPLTEISTQLSKTKTCGFAGTSTLFPASRSSLAELSCPRNGGCEQMSNAIEAKASTSSGEASVNGATLSAETRLRGSVKRGGSEEHSRR